MLLPLQGYSLVAPQIRKKKVKKVAFGCKYALGWHQSGFITYNCTLIFVILECVFWVCFFKMHYTDCFRDRHINLFPQLEKSLSVN